MQEGHKPPLRVRVGLRVPVQKLEGIRSRSRENKATFVAAFLEPAALQRRSVRSSEPDSGRCDRGLAGSRPVTNLAFNVQLIWTNRTQRAIVAPHPPRTAPSQHPQRQGGGQRSPGPADRQTLPTVSRRGDPSLGPNRAREAADR